MGLQSGRQRGSQLRETVDRRLLKLEEAISVCENAVLDQELEEGGGGGSSQVVEKLSMPKFSGNPLEYVEFRALFSELIATVKVSESAKMEYLKKSLDSKLLYIIRGAKDRKEAFRRLDEHFADRTGSIRTILRNLVAVDLSK